MGSHAARPVDLLAKPRVTGRCEASRRSDGKATTLRSSRADLAIPGLSCVWDVHASLGLCRSLLPLAFDLEKSSDMVGAAHDASKSCPSNLKLALVAYWYGLALCEESSRHIWHIRMVNARPGARA